MARKAHHDGLSPVPQHGVGDLQANDAAERYREKTVRVVLGQILPGRERHPPQTLEAADVLGQQVETVHAPAIEVDVEKGPVQCHLQALHLQHPDFFPSQGFDRLHGHGFIHLPFPFVSILLAQIRPLHIVVLHELRRVSGEHDAARFEHIGPLRHGQGPHGVLFDQ